MSISLTSAVFLPPLIKEYMASATKATIITISPKFIINVDDTLFAPPLNHFTTLKIINL